MGDIAQNDFQEYNSRPYSRYSLNAILNLHDFAALHGDKEMAEAAQVVLDLSEAKFAATSNRGRRIVPFRRLSSDDGDGKSYLYQSISGADHEVTRAMLLSGQTQTLDPTGGQKHDDGIVPPMEPYQKGLATLAEMVNAATSAYRLPHPVLIAAVERQTFEQTIRHTGVERVEQSPAFTISAGGVRTPPTSTVVGLGNPDDRGAAMPTVIIPTIAGTHMEDLFRFDGVGTHHERAGNTCVAPGFACGWQPKMSAVFSRCTRRQAQAFATTFFVSSAECFPTSPGPHFYLAGRINDCREAFCNSQWGIMEIVEAVAAGSRGRSAESAAGPGLQRVSGRTQCGVQSGGPERHREGRLCHCRWSPYHVWRCRDQCRWRRSRKCRHWTGGCGDLDRWPCAARLADPRGRHRHRARQDDDQGVDRNVHDRPFRPVQAEEDPMKKWLFGKSLAAAAVLLMWVPCAQADPPGPVTACALDTQVNAGLNLAQALGFGGVIRFACPAGSTIRVTGRYALKVSTLIEGGDMVTLDGQGSFGPMLSSSQNVILRRLKLRGFAQRPIAQPVPGAVSIGRIRGTVPVAAGNAELDRVTIENSDLPIEVHGIATVLDSVFSGNRSVVDLSLSGTARIERTRFTGNSSAIFMSRGWIRSCSFDGQTAGAVSITSPTGPVEIRHSTFSGIRGKSAIRASQRSGGAGPQTVTLRANVLTDNDGGLEGAPSRSSTR